MNPKAFPCRAAATMWPSNGRRLREAVAVTHLWRWAPWQAAVAATISAMMVAGCSNQPATPKASPHHSATAQETASPSLVAGDPGDPMLLPVQSPLPIDQASAALVAEWQPYVDEGTLTLIPDTSVPFQRPVVPPVTDGTGGAVNRSTEQQWVDAFMREQAWENWAISHSQLDFVTNNIISAHAAETGLYLPDGATGLRIQGTRWPSALRVVLVPQPAASSPPLSTSDSYAILATYREGWSVDAVFPNGHTSALMQQVDQPGETDFFVGHLDASKRQLGELWYSSVAGNCGGQVPNVVAELCSQ